MVFFNCGECGESMRKAQVEKHYKFKCRNCQCLSCVDCGKEFWGEEYQKHTKCISEDEKYGGKDYKPKPNANKGERKQEEWTEQVQRAIDKCKDQKLKAHLEKMKEYSNIPRKKAKFENFIKNSLRVPPYLATKLWEVISAENPVNKETNTNEAESTSPNDEESPASTDNQNGDVKQLNKRERKEERQKQKGKKDKKHRHAGDTQREESAEKVKAEKKKRKRKHDEDEEESPLNTETENQDPVPKKKKKRNRHEPAAENGVDSEGQEDDQPKRKKLKGQKQLKDFPLNDSTQSQDSDAEAAAVKPTKFNMESAIVQVLTQADGQEVKLKKLRKKVLAEYFNCNSDGHLSEEKISVKLDKKLKNPKFKVHKDRVKLVK